MIRKADIFYILCWVTYIIFTRLYYVRYGINILIPTTLFIAMGAWLYGTTGGLMVILGCLPFHYIVFCWLNEAEVNWEGGIPALSYIFLIIFTFIISLIKTIHGKVETLNLELDNVIIKNRIIFLIMKLIIVLNLC